MNADHRAGYRAAMAEIASRARTVGSNVPRINVVREDLMYRYLTVVLTRIGNGHPYGVIDQLLPEPTESNT